MGLTRACVRRWRGWLRAAAGTATLRNTLIAENWNGTGAGATEDDVSGAVDSLASSYNLIGDGAGTNLTHGEQGNQVGNSANPVHPLLAPLGWYGGPTQTRAALPGSPAIDAGDNSGAPATDQRGRPRIVDADGDGTATIDIGAFEVSAVAEAGDVYSIEEGGVLLLDGSRSEPAYRIVDGDSIALFEWDLDNNGVYETSVGGQYLTVPWG